MKLFLYITFYFFITAQGLAQQIKLSRPEKCWALFHPFAAFKIKKINQKIQGYYNEHSLKISLDRFTNGGKLDAFRHSFFMAAFAQKIKINKLRKLGIAHEKANYAQFLKAQYEEGEISDSLSCVMDLKNNELGFKIGAANKNADPETLIQIVIEQIKNGQALIMKRNNKGEYLDCNGEPLKILPSEKKWTVNKCLVSSNFDYIN